MTYSLIVESRLSGCFVSQELPGSNQSIFRISRKSRLRPVSSRFGLMLYSTINNDYKGVVALAQDGISRVPD